MGAPAVFSVLRLWVEAGGDRQTTLLLVANVDPANLIAALITTASWLFAAALVAVFAIGGILLCSDPTSALRRYRFARWSVTAPRWLKLGVFALAVATWQVLYLPLLCLAACAAFGWHPSRGRGGGWLLFTLATAGYAVLIGPMMVDAFEQDAILPIVLFIAPPLLIAAGAPGPIAPGAAQLFARLCSLILIGLLAWGSGPMLRTPVLPAVALTVQSPGADRQVIRGFVVSSDDVSTTVLRDRGGVEFIPNAHITDRILCPDLREVPLYRLRIHRFQVEESLLQGAGRATRPTVPTNPRCRATVE